jgi:hypothetical protein
VAGQHRPAARLRHVADQQSRPALGYGLLGEALDKRELEQLLEQAYDLVVAKLPASRRPGAVRTVKKAKRGTRK